MIALNIRKKLEELRYFLVSRGSFPVAFRLYGHVFLLLFWVSKVAQRLIVEKQEEEKTELLIVDIFSTCMFLNRKIKCEQTQKLRTEKVARKRHILKKCFFAYVLPYYIYST